MKRFLVAMIAATFLFAGAGIGCRKEYLKANPVITEVSERLRIVHGIAHMELNSVSSYSYEEFYRDLLYLHANNIKELKITLCNPGGSIFHMWAMYDALKLARDHGLNVETHAAGLIASAAVPLYLLGQKRTIAPNAYVMIHPHSGKLSEYNKPSLNKMYKAWTKAYAQILVDNTRITMEDAIKYLTGSPSNTNWFNAKEAVLLEIAHYIRGN